MREFLILILLGNMLLASKSEELLNSIKNSSQIETKDEEKRVEKFSKDVANQTKLLNDARRELALLKMRSDELTKTMENNEKILSDLTGKLKEKSSILGEFFGVIKESVLEFRAHIDDSIISSELKNRKDNLNFVDKANSLPKKEQIENYWKTVFEEIIKGGEIKKFDSLVVNSKGEINSQTITRVGSFALISQGKYLYPSGENIYEYKTQPANAKNYENSSGYSDITIDPTRGDLINILDKKIGFLERMSEGGVIGYFILILGAVGLVIGLIRSIKLIAIKKSVDNQIKTINNILENNPLGRVVIARKNSTYEEAILKESIELEKGLNTLKLLAAVAPLLGLLGTVVGMIATFESITIFGTNDPKLMAGGISLALVTTMQGLIVAVPLLFIHAFLSAKSDEIVDLIEYESLGTINE